MLLLLASFLINQWRAFDRLFWFGQHRGDLEHLSCTLTVTCGDARRVDIEETTFLEELMCCVRQIVPDSRDRRDKLGSGTQVGVLAQVLVGVSLCRQRVCRAITLT